MRYKSKFAEVSDDRETLRTQVVIDMGRRQTNQRLTLLLLLIVVIMTAGCAVTWPGEDVSMTAPYNAVIGLRYEVVSDTLDAYDIRISSKNEIVRYRTLVPKPGIAGREIAFGEHVKRGRRFTITGVWKKPVLFDNPVYYRIAFDDTGDTVRVPTLIELFAGNEGEGTDLNSDIYLKLSNGQ